ncbi:MULTISPECIES: efflux RND transporter periplasmic adaptor subunit [Halomonadaceae]|uniref:Efflux RND transporter periplasmic adaptor subunit n=1 Tax=Vreelandella piezotolerans TaxID=2609667 RepID=A0ABQ6XD91_9GAMM|nr:MULTISPECIES: efflux RND transporter periplasmic adaptor subunit [Halomonas]KAE8439983.1 efflux RND transporter periplasmic adaptor subunit [Halomonas piezotolerans]MCG7589473.1 efflux RND transporter periplasmic adaptor subunit [Halomonas sp. McD50-5]MCG7615634.1 efflux RND transporter periplasmic adaptor subunit [Halomonas sp. McD50-4]QJA23520.1 efflux RND transporter periplasmic adaptor subunit [Halomonas piezotolerans]TNH19963.1 efflux RND transporter periplasmic adaptor subunit [Halomo
MKRVIHSGRASLVTLIAALALTACGQEQPQEQQSQQQEAPPHPVEVTEIARRDIPLDKSYPSLLRSDSEVTLVARVSGFLEERHFEPGQMVEQGDRLYTIEPDLYQATVNQREADLQSARAELARAQRDAQRFEQLLSQNSVSRQQYDQALAEQRVAQANVAQAEAALTSANLDLGYSNVTAPVSGMISLSQINVGNLVTSGTELATITPLDPLEVRFQLPQRDAFELRRQLGSDGDASQITARLRVPGLDGSEGSELEGRLDFLGSRVDTGTSTVQASATFANPDGAVLPGQFVRVRIEGLKRFGVLAVPEIAVTQGLMGPLVYVLDDENKARERTVQLGEVAGPWQIIRDGLEPGDRVVVGDPAGLEAGVLIDPQPFSGSATEVVEEAMQEDAQEEAQAAEAMQQADGAQPAAEGEEGAQ